FPRGNGSRSERGGSESSESSSVLSGLQDMENVVKYGGGMERLQMGSFMPLDIRKTADELSTVSEVSEESSKNGMIRVRNVLLFAIERSRIAKLQEWASSDIRRTSSRFATAKGALASAAHPPNTFHQKQIHPDSTTSGSFVPIMDRTRKMVPITVCPITMQRRRRIPSSQNCRKNKEKDVECKENNLLTLFPVSSHT
ncbi:uncharacterized protein TNIN_497761, partial [Trichonephila inaurata madagascariensis]